MTTPKKRGRPKRHGPTASTWLQVRCEPQHKATWEWAATVAKLPLSAWVKRCLDAAAKP
jgi:predicted HicB family RNase H-like nuclease